MEWRNMATQILVNIGNGLPSVRPQAIIWTNPDLF